jgi:hypothetical protein
MGSRFLALTLGMYACKNEFYEEDYHGHASYQHLYDD